ncbi:phage holin family protein [Bacteroides sp. OttesenSCG-928-D19]|nr:phage holin family protein [Bacteroides sp. OttesenSCG-928-N06]MDL2304794.1 phage holin family protein [Bacteroides sp. OttesenSCG-928-D19]
MFSDKNNKNFQQIIEECKKYIELQKEYIQLELIEKLTIIISRLILVVLIILLSIVVLFYISFSLVYLLEPYVGGLTFSYLIVAGLNVSLILILYTYRNKLIVNPILNFIAGLFHNDDSTI